MSEAVVATTLPTILVTELPLSLLGEFDLAVIVAMSIMVMMKVTVYDVTCVIAVRNGFVSASGAMCVSSIMGTTGMTGAATIEGMLVYVIIMLMMEVSIMQVIYVVTMLNCCVSAGTGMLVVVLTMCFTVAHF